MSRPQSDSKPGLAARALRTLPFAALTIAIAAPTAAAASLPVYGTFDWVSWGGLFVILSLIGAVAMVGAGRAFVRGLPGPGKFISANGFMVFIVCALVAAAMNPGGALSWVEGEETTASAVASDASAGTTGEFSTALYESTTDLTVYAADSETKSNSIAPSVKVFPAGDEVSEKSAFEGSATPEYTATASSGTATINGIQVQSLGCEVDIYYDLSGYYQQILRDQGICRDKNALGNNDVALPTAYLDNVGTLSLSKSDTSLTCSAGSQCTYSLILRNSESNSVLKMPAVKFHTATNFTLDSIDSGDCEIVEVSSTQYIKFNGASEEVGPLGSVTCNIDVTYASGSSEGSFLLTADDLFQAFDASAWNTNSNVRGATATSDVTVSAA